jgi:hypothetical protein
VNAPNTRTGLVNQRRSQRMLLSVPLLVSEPNENGVLISEEVPTMVVDADGCLIRLKMKTAEGQELKIKNLLTGEETTCKVVDVTAAANNEQEVGVAFSEESPNFWRVSFPPPDWSPRSLEAKRYGPPAAAAVPVRSTIAKK